MRNLGDAKIAEQSQRFFKSGKGEYAEGDKFLGIRTPVLREYVKKHEHVDLDIISQLLKSCYHEERLWALLLLVRKFSRSGHKEREVIYHFYLSHTEFINNWDLVDCSAYYILGKYLEDKDRQVLYGLAKSSNLWERRVSIISTLHFIRNHDFHDALSLAETLLIDNEDLIHKAVGWMLRETGNRDKKIEDMFLKKYYRKMPRTMLRYAIEKYPESERQRYLKGLI